MGVLPLLTCFFALVLWSTAGAESAEQTLTLEQCVQIALEHHPSLRGARASVDAAQQRVRQQITAYLPRGRFTYSFSRQALPVEAAVRGVDVGSATVEQATQTFNFNTSSFALRQPLFDFGKTLDSIESAQASLSATESDSEATRLTVVFNAKRAYYAVLSGQRLVEVAAEALGENLKHLEASRARHKGGIAAEFDVAAAEAQAANGELGLVGARKTLRLARENLSTAMGLETPADFDLVSRLEYRPVTLEPEQALARALSSRPELRSLDAKQEASKQQIGALRKSYLPAVFGDAEYSFTGREYPLQEGWFVGVSVNVPLFDSVLTITQIGEAKANLRALDAQIEGVRQQIGSEVRQSYVSLREAEERIRLGETIADRTRKSLELAEGRYTEGVGDIIELTNAQISRTSARAGTVLALHDYAVSLAQLERAIAADAP